MKNAVLSMTKALDFAARKHTDHRRKGEREEPYINHLAGNDWVWLAEKPVETT